MKTASMHKYSRALITSSREGSSGVEYSAAAAYNRASSASQRINKSKNNSTVSPNKSCPEVISADPCDSVYKASSQAVLKARSQRLDPTLSDTDDYLEGCKKVVQFMCSLWREQRMCDVMIKAKEDRIQAHKLVLGAHSEFLTNKFSEYPKGDMIMIDMQDFSISTIMDLLHYVYTTELNVTSQTVGPLIKASEELGIVAVYQAGVEFLSDITVENAVYLYSIAESYDLHEYRDKIINFILRNFIDVSDTDHFVLIPFHCLLSLLSDDRLNVDSELVVFYAVVRWIDHNRTERIHAAPELLDNAVRLQFVSPECIARKVESVHWLFDTPETQAVLLNIYKFQALQMSGSNLSLPTQRPRRSLDS